MGEREPLTAKLPSIRLSDSKSDVQVGIEKDYVNEQDVTELKVVGSHSIE